MPPEASVAPAAVPAAISRALVKLAEIEDGAEHAQTRLRIGKADGVPLTGRLFDLRTTRLTLIDEATGGFTEVDATDIRTLEVELPRRAVEWGLAGVGVIVAIMALTAFALIPGVKATDEGHMILGFFLVYVLVAPLFDLALRRTRLGDWVKEWRMLYPDAG